MASIRNEWSGASLASGRYRVGERLGRGGMGTVYKARDTRLLADVVVKVPHGAILEDEGFAARFEAEIHTLAQLSHPQIVKVTDVDRHDGVPFFVMQYLPGGSLEDRRRSGPPPDGFPVILDPRDLASWLPGIAGALDYLHERGFVHRDVKPANILFDARGNPFLSDFGVIKVLASAEPELTRRAQTGAGMVLGTAEYMAPEQVMGEAVDGRADQYALAVSVYELLCGRRPFEDATTTKLFVMQIKDEPPALEAFAPWIPAEVSRAVLKGLAKEREGRYPSCDALAGAVREAVAATLCNRPSRVRLRCPSCGKSMSLPSEKFELLRQRPRVFPCPACQAPIRGEKTVQFSGEGPAGTGVSISTSAFNAAVPNRTVVERPGTLVERIGTVVELPGSGLERSGTVLEASGTMIERNFTTLEPSLSLSPPGAGPSPGKWPVWLIGGLAAGVTAIGIVVGSTLAKSRPTPPPSPTTPVPVLAASTAPGPVPAPASSSPAGVPAGVVASPGPKPEVAKVAAKPAPAPKPTPLPAPEPKRIASLGSKPPAPARTYEHLKTPQILKDVRSSPARFVGKEVELRHLYLIGEVRRVETSAGATRTLAISEPDLDIRVRDGLAGARPRGGTEVVLDIHPSLAAQLDAMPRASSLENLAVPTVQVDREPGEEEPRIRVVRLEFLKSYTPVVYHAGFKGDLRLNYETLVIEPGKASESKGSRDLWTRNERLGFLETRLSKAYDRNRSLQFKAIALSIASAQNAIASRAAQAEFARQNAIQADVRKIMSGGR